MDVKFSDCPVECPNQPEKRYDVNRHTLCKTCPRQKALNVYIRAAERVLEKQLGEHKFSVLQLDNRVGLVSATLDLPIDKVRVPLGRLISIYRSEQSRRDRILKQQ